ncbi:MAG: hypothetical protein H6581_02985 [Bacteroidia bacterium]|nr:hypothetical protein [Bacteroidia bacterium]
MTEITADHLLIKIKTATPREYLSDLHEATLTAIQQLTQASDEPMSPQRSEAVHFLAELLKQMGHGI